METIAFIVNPTTRYAHKFSEEFFQQQLASSRLVFFYAEHEGHEKELATQAIKIGATTIVAVGGDGTVHHIAQVLCNKNIPLAILPTTIGSSFANYMAYQKNSQHLVSVLQTGRLEKVDLLEAYIDDGQTIISTSYVGIGFSAFLMQELQQVEKSFYSRFWRKAFNIFDQYKRQTFRVDYNFTKQEETTFEYLISNIDQFGGRLKVIKHSDNTDGIMNVLKLENVSFFRTFFYFVNNVLGISDMILDESDYSKTERIKLKFDKPTAIQIDMNTYNVQRNMVVEVLPKALTLKTLAVKLR